MFHENICTTILKESSMCELGRKYLETQEGLGLLPLQT